MSCHIKSYHIISYHTISHHITSHHITSYHILLHRVISCHSMTYHIISHHIIPYHIISRHILSYHIKSLVGVVLVAPCLGMLAYVLLCVGMFESCFDHVGINFDSFCVLVASWSCLGWLFGRLRVLLGCSWEAFGCTQRRQQADTKHESKHAQLKSDKISSTNDIVGNVFGDGLLLKSYKKQRKEH